jgi:hypothetical protein
MPHSPGKSAVVLLLILAATACTPVATSIPPTASPSATASATKVPDVDPYGLISHDTLLTYVEGMSGIQPHSGWRSSATEGEAEALDYVAAALDELEFLRASGLEVERQGFSVYLATESWDSRLFLTARGRQTEVAADALRGHRHDVIKALRFDSDGVLNDSTRNPVQLAGKPALVRSADDLAALERSDLQGKVVFLDSEIIADREEAVEVVDELIGKGAAALVLVASKGHAKQLGEGRALEELEADDVPPILFVRMEDLAPTGVSRWSELERIEDVRLVWDADVFSPGKSANLVARIVGADSSRAVILGAHIDSANSPGAVDNGVNCAALLEVARVLNDAQIRPAVDIYLVWFGSEEIGLYGSQYFVNTHGELLDRALGAFIMDGIIVSTPAPLFMLDGWSYSRFGDYELPFARYLERRAAGRGIVIQEVDDIQGLASDNSVFNGFVPTAGFGFGSPANDVAHSPYDTADAVWMQAEWIEDVASMALMAALQTGNDLPELRVAPQPDRRALIVASHTEAVHMTPASLVALEQALAWEGFDVDVIPYGQTVTFTDLARAELVVALPVIDLPSPDGDVSLYDEAWTEAEVERMVTYVENGGFLVLTNSASRIQLGRVLDANEDWEDANQLAEPFGITFVETGGQGASIRVAGRHPLLAGEATLRLLEDNAVYFTMDDGETLVEDDEGLIAGLVEYGEEGGHVLTLADLAILGLAGIGDPGYDNLNFLHNLAHYARNR